MKVFLHIGPHKTATTSLQWSLRKRFEDGDASYYYPPTPQNGPGHAELGWDFLGLHGREPDASVLFHEIDGAVEAGFESIVFSSEVFSRAGTSDEGFARFAPIAEAHDCELILTLTPLVDRIIPELQECIKQGESLQFYDLGELVGLLNRRPGLRADFVSSAIRAIQPSCASVIFPDKSQPAKTFEAMSVILDEELNMPDPPVLNRSLPFLQAKWMSDLNLHRHALSAREVGPLVDAAFNAMPAAHGPLDVPYPPLPTNFTDHVRSIWTAQRDFLDAESRAGRVRLF